MGLISGDAIKNLTQNFKQSTQSLMGGYSPPIAGSENAEKHLLEQDLGKERAILGKIHTGHREEKIIPYMERQ